MAELAGVVMAPVAAGMVAAGESDLATKGVAVTDPAVGVMEAADLRALVPWAGVARAQEAEVMVGGG